MIRPRHHSGPDFGGGGARLTAFLGKGRERHYGDFLVKRRHSERAGKGQERHYGDIPMKRRHSERAGKGQERRFGPDFNITAVLAVFGISDVWLRTKRV